MLTNRLSVLMYVDQSFFSVSSRMQKLNLTMEDMAILLAFVILMADREGLQRTDQVERLQDKMLPVSCSY